MKLVVDIFINYFCIQNYKNRWTEYVGEHIIVVNKRKLSRFSAEAVPASILYLNKKALLKECF